MTFFLKSFEDTLKQVQTCLNVESKKWFYSNFLIFCFFFEKLVF